MSQISSVFTFDPGYSQMANTGLQASNGDYLLAGRMFNQDGTSAAVAVRVTEAGNPVWEKSYSGPDTTLFSSMTEIADGTFIVTGSYFYSNMAGDEDIWIVNLDANGDIIWETKFGYAGYQNDGYAVAATSDGGFVVSGLNLQHGAGHSASTLVLKYDANKNLEWQQQFDQGVTFAVQQTTDGGYILSGAHNLPGSLNSNVYVLRLNKDGDQVWATINSNTEIYVLLQSGVTQTSDGSFVVAAKSVLTKLDDYGNILWERQNGNFGLGSVRELPDGSLVVGGTFNANYFDHAYVAALDATGDDILWDNTELLFNSGMAEIFINQFNMVTGVGYGPLQGDQSEMLLAIYYPSKSFSGVGTARTVARTAPRPAEA